MLKGNYDHAVSYLKALCWLLVYFRVDFTPRFQIHCCIGFQPVYVSNDLVPKKSIYMQHISQVQNDFFPTVGNASTALSKFAPALKKQALKLLHKLCMF